MKSNFSMKLQVANASIAIALLSGGCAMAPKAIPEFAATGSSWTVNYRATGSFGSVSDQRTAVVLPNRIWQGRAVRALEGKNFTTLSDPATGAWIAQVRGTSPIISWDPALGYEWPMTVGKTWKSKHRVMVHATNQTIDIESRWMVESYGDVTVPAGTFKAFKVTYSDNIGNEAVHWWSPQVQGNAKTRTVRTSKHRAGAGTIDTELVSYSPRK